MPSIFITGTDTNVGKTTVSKLLLEDLNKKNQRTLGFKPIASGCHQTKHGLRNDDALILQKASSIKTSYDIINPFAFEPAIAPNIAAELENKKITVDMLLQKTEDIRRYQADHLIIEGAGGLLTPLNQQQLYTDYIIAAELPVVVVVAIRLGCLNHALLTMATLDKLNIKCLGWVANHCEPNMTVANGNIKTLCTHITKPLLAEIKHGQISAVFKASVIPA